MFPPIHSFFLAQTKMSWHSLLTSQYPQNQGSEQSSSLRYKAWRLRPELDTYYPTPPPANNKVLKKYGPNRSVCWKRR